MTQGEVSMAAENLAKGDEKAELIVQNL